MNTLHRAANWTPVPALIGHSFKNCWTFQLRPSLITEFDRLSKKFGLATPAVLILHGREIFKYPNPYFRLPSRRAATNDLAGLYWLEVPNSNPIKSRVPSHFFSK
jgi:hypothetical protein